MKNIIAFSLLLVLFIVRCSDSESLIIERQNNGPWQTNCYLLYDTQSKEAAIIDVGWPVNSILTCIEHNNLKLKYIFLTHCHQDHICGVPQLLTRFPDAKLCFTKVEYNDMKYYSNWETIYVPELVEAWQKDSTIVNLMNFNYCQIAKPDIFVEENQKYKLGDLIIQALKIPGHSRGSVGYFIKNNLFSGDLVYYHTAGLLDYRFGSKADIIKSMQRLFDLFPDETIIYAGHGPISTIGLEEESNTFITRDKATF